MENQKIKLIFATCVCYLLVHNADAAALPTSIAQQTTEKNNLSAILDQFSLANADV